MAYKNFNEKKLKTEFGIKQENIQLFDMKKIKLIEPSDRLIYALDDAKLITLSTEKALSERVISPVMAEIKRNNPKRIQIFSGEIINADSKRDLNGEIDFIITRETDTISPQAPILCVTEAKIGRLSFAIPQAAAQMIGVRVFNQKNGDEVEIIHGAITDGNVWKFLKLENNTLWIDDQDYFINNLPQLLGTFQEIIEFYH
jgi:hypothetical protein